MVSLWLTGWMLSLGTPTFTHSSGPALVESSTFQWMS